MFHDDATNCSRIARLTVAMGNGHDDGGGNKRVNGHNVTLADDKSSSSLLKASCTCIMSSPMIKIHCTGTPCLHTAYYKSKRYQLYGTGSELSKK